MAEGPTLAQIDAGHESPQDTMRAIMAEMGGIDTAAPAEPASSADTASEPAPEGAGKTAAERARDERGRFTKAEQDAAEAAAKADKSAGREKAVSKPEGGDEPINEAAAEDDLDPPHDWPLDRQTEFRKLPPALKTLVLESDRTGREIAAERSKYQAIESVLAPRRQAFALEGLADDAAALRKLFALSDYVDQHPAEFIQQLMQAKGLTFEAPAQPNGNGQGQPDPNDADYDDPVIRKIVADNQRLAAELNQIKQGLQGSVQAQRQQEISQVQSALEAFRNEKDERGRLKHPYMSETRIRKAMSAMLRSGAASDHVEAYDMACHADPEIRAKIAAAAEAERERARAAEARKKAEAAQRAGSSVTGTPAGPAKPELTGKSAREDLRQVAAEMGFRFGA